MGSLPDLPSKRLALDIDGSQLLTRNASIGSSWTDQTTLLANCMGATTANSLEYDTSGNTQQVEHSLLFPSSVDLGGLFFAVATSPIGYSYSTDTTTGADGTWSAYNNAGHVGNPVPYFRTEITPLSLTGVKGLRIKHTSTYTNNTYRAFLYSLHVYGTYAQSGDRCLFWNPGNNLPLDPNFLNYQDAGKGTTPAIRSFTVKNVSAAKTATNVQVVHTGMDGAAFADGAGTGVMLSLDQTNWYNTVGVGNLAPGAQSQTVYVRNVLPSALSIGPHAARLALTMDSMA